MRVPRCLDGWRGAALVAVTYIYFLIFAQFGFLARLAEQGIEGTTLRVAMAAMAAGGILFSIVAAKLATHLKPAYALSIGFLIAELAALLALFPLAFVTAALAAFLIGAGLGILTVSLVTHLPKWTGQSYPILMVGIGTGVGYLVSNVPAVFTASPAHQAVLAACLCVLGAIVASSVIDNAEPEPTPLGVSFPLVLAGFAALVWLDSAAFYIIQHTPLLKAGTWMGDVHLWVNGGIHLVAALVAALLLRRHRMVLVLSCAVIALGFACTLLLHPALVLSASVFYPVGVSLYSTALVAYPAFLSGARTVEERARIACWLYCVAGWIASALGIGMGQNLGFVPPAFVAVAGAVVLVPALFAIAPKRARELLLLAAAVLVALGIERSLPASHPAPVRTAVERGREVYINEGCISCHSQYVRPGTPDELMWGPVQSMEQVHAQRPPLIGNRRQGPDLAEVGARRSPLWLKAHFFNPAAISSRSPMPSYGFLFQDGRGDDLIAYLSSLNIDNPSHLQSQAVWQPSVSSWSEANIAGGAELYARECATCHNPRGESRLQWGAQFRQLPPDLAASSDLALRYTPAQLAGVIRFGFRGTDMPGHEYLTDQEITSLAQWLLRHSAQPVPHS